MLLALSQQPVPSNITALIETDDPFLAGILKGINKDWTNNLARTSDENLIRLAEHEVPFITHGECDFTPAWKAPNGISRRAFYLTDKDSGRPYILTVPPFKTIAEEDDFAIYTEDRGDSPIEEVCALMGMCGLGYVLHAEITPG